MKKFLCLCVVVITCLIMSKTYASTTIFYDTRGTKYEGVVERIARLNIINGVSNTTYAPNKSVTRAELAKIIVKMRGIEDYAEGVEYKKVFSDVKKTDWYYPYVVVASDLELLNGYSDGTFKPNKEVTYAELIAILLRNLGYTRLSEQSSNGWYWNYVVKMREIELNDNVGEFDYEKPAKRGDVAMFVWNALITNRWAIESENESTGFTYTYSESTPLETFFDEYSFVDNAPVNAIGGYDSNPMIVTTKGAYSIDEKVPLYVLGGNVTGLYKKDTSNLIGVTFDEKFQNEKIVSGPIFYLKEQGYNLLKAKKSDCFGSRDNANYAYLILNENKEILRAVYVDTSETIIVNEVTVSEKSGDSEDKKIQEIKLNGDELRSTNTALVKNGMGVNWKNLKKNDIITNLGNGLYMYSTNVITDEITDVDGKSAIWIGDEKYIISDMCVYYRYNAKEASEYSLISSSRLKEFVGTEATVYLNVAEEVCKIEFGKTKEENEKFKIGYVTRVRDTSADDEQSVEIMLTPNNTEKAIIKAGEKSYAEVGKLMVVWNDDDDTTKFSMISKDQSFDNDIAIKYEYDAKVIEDPMIGEYIADDSTEYYKVVLKYKNNSTTVVEKCTMERLKLSDMRDLLAYKLNLVYDENMRVVRVYAIVENNKFDNRIALVKDKKVSKTGEDKYTYKAILSVTGSTVGSYEIDENVYSKYRVGDIITFKPDEKDDKKIVLEETFKRESIGYKRDLIVKDFDIQNRKITLNDGSIMNLSEDVYVWNGSRINLNTYRIVKAKVLEQAESGWSFNSLEMATKDNLSVEEGDRIAIGELDKVIVIYSGYEN